jgi:LCP family protein required for cell wall assembly
MSEESARTGRTGKHKAFVFFNLFLATATIIGGSGLVYANWKLSNRNVVTIDSANRGDRNLNLPAGDLSAKNFLITGSDNDSCIDKTSPFAGGFGNRAAFGERSDTIMIIRVNPKDNQAAILSFPRDLWVKQPGSTRSNRINSNFDKKNPNRLIRTIKENFDIAVDHYINIDFCAFKEVVDAVGGVRVPFPYRARDLRTGFKVQRARVCYTFQGDHALAYMRSRRYQYLDPATRKWVRDGTSDWGRINRQQDFIKRMVKKALDKSASNPRVASGILNASLRNVITDDRLTPLTVLQLGQAMKNFDANSMGSYTMPGVGQLIDKESVIVPDLEGTTAKKILAVFQGKASLSTTVQNTTAVPASAVDTSGVIAFAAMVLTPPTVPPTTTTTTLPSVAIEQNPRGIVPPNDPTCQF